MTEQNETLFVTPILPYIRHAKFAVRKPWNIPERRLLDYLLIYVQEGSCTVHINDVRYDFHPGEFCFIQPNTFHTLEGTTRTITPFIHMDIFYNPNREDSFPTRPGQVDLTPHAHILQPVLNDMKGIEIPVRLKMQQTFRFRDLLLKTVGVWQNRDPISQLESQSLAMELVLLIMKDHTNLQESKYPSSASLNWIHSYLSFHLSEPLSVGDMARQARMSTSHFSDMFLKQFGVTPYKYLYRLRIQHAQELLEKTELPQDQIAEYCGFSDIHHFSKAFKKETGQTPGHYRKS